MNYNDLTDFEINSRAAERQGVGPLDDVRVSDCGGLLFSNYKVYNPCKNPQDAFPIIFENRIEIHPRDIRVSRNKYIKGWGAVPESCSRNYEIFSEGENPLRAAMIVYLMMGDE